MTPERFAKLRRALERRQPDLTVLADGVNKPHNVSAILRTADAVGVHRIHSISTSGSMRRHHMIAGGVKNWVGLTLHASIEDALASLRADGWRLVAAHASPEARDFRSIDYTAKVAVIVGAELLGPSPAALAEADEHVAIPMLGLGESVNVSVATAVILLEAQRQRAAAGFYARPRLAARGARAHAVRVVLSRRRGALPRARPPLPAARPRRRDARESAQSRSRELA